MIIFNSVETRSRQSNFVAQLRLASIVISIAVIGLGCSVIVGWLLDLAFLKSVVANRVTMKVSTALGLILGGICLFGWHLQQKKSSSIVRVGLYILPGLAIAFSLVVLIEYGFGWDLGTSWLSLPDSPDAVDAVAGGRMSPNTALSFVLLHGAILLLVRKYYTATQLLVTIVAAIASLSLIGHIYNLPSFYSGGSLTGMAIHTAIGFLGLSLASLAACSQRGWMRVITREEAGGLMARWLLPLVVCIPPSLGGLFWWLFQGNVYYLELIVALRIMLEMILFGVIIWWTAYKLNHTEAKLRQSEERFRRTFEDAASGEALVTLDGKFIRVNRSLSEIVGYSQAELLGKTFQEITHPNDLNLDLSYVQQMLASEIRTYQMEKRYYHQKGHLVWVLLSVSLVRDSDGKPLYFISQIQDINQRKQAEARLKDLVHELERSNQELDEFASVVSHDLLSPLRKQQMFIDLLQEDDSEVLQQQGKEYLERMMGLNSRMERLIRNLLAYARITTQAQPFVSVSLDEVVDDVLYDLEKEITQTRARIEVESLPTIMGDRLQLRQLFQNLLQNALKFHSNQRTLQVTIAQLPVGSDNNFYQIVVEDNGIGFEPEQQKKIFTPFHRLYSNSKYPGTGLGLAICDKIVRRHGGTITAQSQPQQGATFTICLPCIEKAGGRRQEAEGSPLT